MNEKDPEYPEQSSKLDRKPYAPPRIEESGRYEHMVLTCLMEPDGPGQCGLDERSML